MTCGSLEHKVGDLYEHHVTQAAAQAFAELQKHQDGKGCQCQNCMHMSVKDWNEWARFLTEDPETADQYLASIARGKNGTLKILMGKLPK